MSINISIIRLLAGPVALYLIMSKQSELQFAALIVMVISVALGLMNTFMLTKADANENQIIHTVSDNIYHLSVFIAFFANHWMSIWMVFIIYSREIIIPYVQSFALQSGIQLSDTLVSSKIKSVCHGLCQVGVLIAMAGGTIPNLYGVFDTVIALLSVATGMSVISFIHYLIVVSTTSPEKQSV